MTAYLGRLCVATLCSLWFACSALAVDVQAGSDMGMSTQSLVGGSQDATLRLPTSATNIGRIGETAGIRQYAKALDGLPQGAELTRGAREVAIYAQVSPSVVLIVNGDSLGSGTLLSPEGLILTNWHVVSHSTEVGVIFKPSTEGAALTKDQLVRARVVRVDEIADLALIKVDLVPPQAKVAKLAQGPVLQVGDDVHAIGHPTGEAWTYTRGIVSQIRKDYRWTTEDKLQHRADIVQTQTPINPGNSGGPLVDNTGEIVGVNSFKGEGEGLNFAVDADAVRVLLGATEDRFAKPIKTAAIERNRSTKCEPKLIKKWRMNKPPGMAASFDENCTGVTDLVMEYPDDQTQPALFLLDTKHTGHVDVIMVDTDRDGYPEYALYDTTGSGKPDLIGYFHNHEFDPYRVEKYTPK